MTSPSRPPDTSDTVSIWSRTSWRYGETRRAFLTFVSWIDGRFTDGAADVAREVGTLGGPRLAAPDMDETLPSRLVDVRIPWLDSEKCSSIPAEVRPVPKRRPAGPRLVTAAVRLTVTLTSALPRRWHDHFMRPLVACAGLFLSLVAVDACDLTPPCQPPAVSTGAGVELLTSPMMRVNGAQATLTGPVTESLLCDAYPWGASCHWSGTTPITAGTYTLQVLAPGYQPVSTQLELTISSVCGRTDVNVAPSSVSLGPCTPMSVAMACQGKTCGEASDGCSGVVNCGACAAGDECYTGSCCTPMSVSMACQGKTCGDGADGCGGRVNCGPCP